MMITSQAAWKLYLQHGCTMFRSGARRMPLEFFVECAVSSGVPIFRHWQKHWKKCLKKCWFMLVYVGFGFPTSSFCPYAICAIQVSYMKELYDKTYILSGERLGRIMVQSVQDQGAAAALTSCAGSGSIADHSMEYGNGMDMVKWCKMILNSSDSIDSMDWFKGKFTGNHRFSH